MANGLAPVILDINSTGVGDEIEAKLINARDHLRYIGARVFDLDWAYEYDKMQGFPPDRVIAVLDEEQWLSCLNFSWRRRGHGALYDFVHFVY